VNLTAPGRDDTLLRDFRAACADLAEAKQAVRAKDTAAARARLRECAARVDAILDLTVEGWPREVAAPAVSDAGPPP
jgi:hypothetical protein